MPELPEVQTVCNDLLNAGLKKAKIIKAQIAWQKILHKCTIQEFDEIIKTKIILDIRRRGKYIIFTLTKDWFLIAHLRMTGRINLLAKVEPIQKHEHFVLYLDRNRMLKYHDTRKFGRWYLTQNLDEIIGHLGLEPLEKEFTFHSLNEMLRLAKTKKIKPFLLDQTKITGIGNIYADESLFLAKIHPETSCQKIPEENIRLLHAAIKKVLIQGIQNMGTTLGTGKTNFYSVANRKGRNKEQLKVFRKENQACSLCGNLIKKIVVAQRGTHFCPTCQKKY